IQPLQVRSGPRGARMARWAGASIVATDMASLQTRRLGVWRPPWQYYTSMNRATPTPATLELTGDGLRLDDAERILRGQVERLSLSVAARKRVERSRRCLES